MSTLIYDEKYRSRAASGTHRTRPGRPNVRLFEGEAWLVGIGALGLLLAAGCAVWMLLYGSAVGAEGRISDAFSFNAALGVFILSTAAILPYSGMRARGRAVFRRAYIALALYSYAAENIQHFRGVNPRFAKNGTVFDETVGILFALVALLLVVFYTVLAVQFFRRRSLELHPKLVTGIRYAMIAVLFSFAAGIWISMNQGRLVGEHGNIMWLHGLGFHALQAVPVVAWLAERTTLTDRARSTLIHVTGAAYVLGLAAIGWQTYLGRPILEWSVWPVAAGLCFLAALAAGGLALRKAILDAGKSSPHISSYEAQYCRRSI
ncbi:hypothetical protein ACFFK0_13675 [Paenibacillus chartarius]|uniref:DUF2306 domain-containing protein n=1 Tax=Paenibacillus chartarius TaxID=747481 RepID=A0ABV6DLG3_9BACL